MQQGYVPPWLFSTMFSDILFLSVILKQKHSTSFSLHKISGINISLVRFPNSFATGYQDALQQSGTDEYPGSSSQM